jgi:hypothetical protein
MGRVLFAALATCGLAACTMPNPAFGPGHGTAAGSESGSGDGDGDPGTSESGPGDGDGDGDGDTGEPTVCDQIRHPPLRLAVQTPSLDCADAQSPLFLKLDPLTFNQALGMAAGSRCTDSTCLDCPEQGYAVGAPDFEGLAAGWSALAEILNLENIPLCAQVTTQTYLGMEGEACLYGSMVIRGHNIENGPLFIASNEAGVPGLVADDPLFADGPPLPVQEPFTTCECESLLSDSTQLDCCVASELEPGFYALDFRGLSLQPDESAPIPSLPNLVVPWDFHVLRAQSIPACDNPQGAIQTSWALVRAN